MSSKVEGIAVWSALSLAALSTGLLVAVTARLVALTRSVAAQLPPESRERTGTVGVTPILGPATGRPYAAPVPAEDRHSPPTGTVKIYPPA
ncbi:hypothetical protein [Planctomonas psychrotolerans]|uniref:hypothetical protein n=1 Tax=Planctomonas psychrotolerans TaxID=2528712 RepID=UPI0012394D33|nr:hypothetical protein [Planctomonas psychrotolerans]